MQTPYREGRKMSLEKEFAKYKEQVANGKHSRQEELESNVDYFPSEDIVPLSINLLVPVHIMNGLEDYAMATGLHPINLLIDLMKNPCVGLFQAQCIPKDEESAAECQAFHDEYDAVLLLTPYGEEQEDELN